MADPQNPFPAEAPELDPQAVPVDVPAGIDGDPQVIPPVEAPMPDPQAPPAEAAYVPNGLIGILHRLEADSPIGILHRGAQADEKSKETKAAEIAMELNFVTVHNLPYATKALTAYQKAEA
jgi:hypothetical protein